MYENFIWLDSYLKKEKSVIEYLGTVYIMPDGCPTPNCDMNDPECVRTKRYGNWFFKNDNGPAQLVLFKQRPDRFARSLV